MYSFGWPLHLNLFISNLFVLQISEHEPDLSERKTVAKSPGCSYEERLVWSKTYSIKWSDHLTQGQQ